MENCFECGNSLTVCLCYSNDANWCPKCKNPNFACECECECEEVCIKCGSYTETLRDSICEECNIAQQNAKCMMCGVKTNGTSYCSDICCEKYCKSKAKEIAAPLIEWLRKPYQPTEKMTIYIENALTEWSSGFKPEFRNFRFWFNVKEVSEMTKTNYDDLIKLNNNNNEIRCANSDNCLENPQLSPIMHQYLAVKLRETLEYISS